MSKPKEEHALDPTFWAKVVRARFSRYQKKI